MVNELLGSVAAQGCGQELYGKPGRLDHLLAGKWKVDQSPTIMAQQINYLAFTFAFAERKFKFKNRTPRKGKGPPTGFPDARSALGVGLHNVHC